MTPEERDLVRGLFDRLAHLERAPRDGDAERVIREGLARAPNALYALVQTVLVQEEALRLANERIESLEARLEDSRDAGRSDGGSFLGTRRTVPPAGAGKWNTGAVLGGESDQPAPQPRHGDRPMGLPPSFGGSRGRPDEAYGRGEDDGPMPGRGGPTGGRMGGGPAGGASAGGEPSRGGSFLGTAAAAAIGAIGGSMLLGGIKSALGGQGGANGGTPGGTPGAAGEQAKGPFAGLFEQLGGDSKGSGTAGGSGELARDAGLGDVGKRQEASQENTGQDQAAHGDDAHGHEDDQDDDDENDDDDNDDENDDENEDDENDDDNDDDDDGNDDNDGYDEDSGGDDDNR